MRISFQWQNEYQYDQWCSERVVYWNQWISNVYTFKQMLNILKQTNDVEMNVVCIRNKKKNTIKNLF